MVIAVIIPKCLVIVIGAKTKILKPHIVVKPEINSDDPVCSSVDEIVNNEDVIQIKNYLIYHKNK